MQRISARRVPTISHPSQSFRSILEEETEMYRSQNSGRIRLKPCLLDMRDCWIHELTAACTRPAKDQVSQHSNMGEEGHSWASTPNQGATDSWWLLKRERWLLRVCLLLGQLSSSGQAQAWKYMVSTHNHIKAQEIWRGWEGWRLTSMFHLGWAPYWAGQEQREEATKKWTQRSRQAVKA